MTNPTGLKAELLSLGTEPVQAHDRTETLKIMQKTPSEEPQPPQTEPTPAPSFDAGSHPASRYPVVRYDYSSSEGVIFGVVGVGLVLLAVAVIAFFEPSAIMRNLVVLSLLGVVDAVAYWWMVRQEEQRAIEAVEHAYGIDVVRASSHGMCDRWVDAQFVAPDSPDVVDAEIRCRRGKVILTAEKRLVGLDGLA